MSRIQINNKNFTDINNIVKLVEKKNPKCSACTKTWVYLKEGYPKILKASGNKRNFLRKLANHGLSIKKIEELRDNR